MLKRVLITGGAGFAGSAIAVGLRRSHPLWDITAFDNLSRRGAEHNLQRFDELGIHFVHGDIRSAQDLETVG